MAKGKYTIESVVKRTEFNMAGQAVEVYEINFITESGVRDRLTVPEDDYKTDSVKATLTAKSELHDSIMGL